jgi:two-component system, sensor histidine kinase
MPDPASPLQVPSVLIIDDNIDAADSLARFLRIGAGFDVRVAYDGHSGFKSAVQQPPDVIVCDIGLPKLDGMQVARDLIAHLPVKPLLIGVTGYGGTYAETQAREAGFDFYLVKPADPFVIEKLIKCCDPSPPAALGK